MSKSSSKKKGQPVALSKKQIAAREKREAEKKERAELAEANKRLAQLVNLHIAGYSLTEIGQAIGATASEVDAMLSADAARYVRSQPALRTYVRNFISSQYAELLAPVMPIAKDASSPKMFEAQDRAVRVLDRMAKLHGAEAPVQKEVSIEAAPEAVEALVSLLAAKNGQGYDTGIFDVVEAEFTEELVDQTQAALESASQAVDDSEDEGWEQ